MPILPSRPLRSVLAAFALLVAPAGAAPLGAQYFAHRALIPAPLDDSTRAPGLVAGFSYLADVQRNAGSAGDDRAWSIRLAALIEAWRFSRGTALYVSAADELAANSLKDGGFNPRGISWELGIGVLQRFHAGHALRAGIVHYCKHEVDNSDPPGREQVPPPGYVPQKRTLSMNALRLELIGAPVRAGSRVRLRGAVAAEGYTSQWDGRRPTLTPENSWKRVRAGMSGALRADVDVTRRGSLYARASGIGLWFAESAEYPVSRAVQHNERVEVGWRAVGGGGTLELYGVTERLFDDVMVVTPRPSRMLGIGLRLAQPDQF